MLDKSQAKRDREDAKRIAKDMRELEKFVPTIPLWQGWEGRWEADEWYTARDSHGVDVKQFVLEWPANHMKMKFRMGGDGTTSFEVAGKGWLTFDRRGVESSFYWKAWDYKNAPKVVIEEVMREQCKRIADRRAYYTSAITVPQIGFTVSPDGKTALIEDIRKIGFRNFMPSGFGTGYTISTKQVRYSNRAKPELEEFIGMSPLYVSTFDAD